MASGETHFTSEESTEVTTSRLARRTKNKMTEILSENFFKTMPLKQQDNEKNIRPSVKEGNLLLNQLYRDLSFLRNFTRRKYLQY